MKKSYTLGLHSCINGLKSILRGYEKFVQILALNARMQGLTPFLYLFLKRPIFKTFIDFSSKKSLHSCIFLHQSISVEGIKVCKDSCKDYARMQGLQWSGNI